MPNASKIIHLFAYGLYLGCTAAAKLLPLELAFRIGQGMGSIGFAVLPRRRELAVDNLMMALGKTEGEARELAREHFRNLGANMLSALKIASMSDEEIKARVTIEYPPELEPYVSGEKQQSWVAMISHMGNWEIYSHLAPLFPHFKFGAVYHRLANDYVDRHFKETRARSGVTLFDRKEGYLKCVSFIRAGGTVGVLVDQYAGLPGTWMPFFGRLTSTSTLAATLAQRSGVQVVPISIFTTGVARWHVAASMPIEKQEDPEILTAKINSEMEKQIRLSPADWLWSHDRWKTPRFVFLLTRSRRRVFYPPGVDPSTLMPYRMVIRGADSLEEAKASVPAVVAIKGGRPDAHVTIAAEEAQREFWKTVPEVDEFIGIAPGESVAAVAEKIRKSGRFEAGILFSPEDRAARELSEGKVRYRIGPPYRFRLNDWKNADGLQDPPASGAERYKRIANGIGAVVE